MTAPAPRKRGVFHSLRACHATGLFRGDCPQPAVVGGAYCYYHDKLNKGLTTPFNEEWYPEWPLPEIALQPAA